MSNYLLSQLSADQIKDPLVRKFVTHVTDLLKPQIYEALYNKSQNIPANYASLVVGVKTVKQYKSVSEVIHERIAAKQPDEIKSMVFDAGPRMELSRSLLLNTTRNTFKDASSRFKTTDFKSAFQYVDELFFTKNLASLIETAAASPAPAAASTSAAHTLKLMLKTVKCLDETDPEWWGKDSISVGGVTVNDKDVTGKITPFSAGTFNDGNVKHFNPDKVLKSFPLDNVHPSTFMAFLTIAEKDSGGFSDFLHDLYEAVKAHLVIILSALGAAAGAIIGAAIGGTVGTAVAGPLGSIIGIAAGLIFGAIIGWLVQVLKDDIFDPQISAITIERNAAFTGPVQRLRYRDFGGSYYMDVYWQAS